MLKILSLSSIALIAGLSLAQAVDPAGSTPTSPGRPDLQPPSSVPVPVPAPGPTDLTIGRLAPPPQINDLTAADDMDVDAIIGVIGLPGGTLADNGETEDCTFTNDLIAVCDIMVCLSDGFCFDTGDDKCYSANGEVIPCP